MATIQSLMESVDVLKRNPVVFGAGLLYAVVVLPQSALSALRIPILPTLMQMVTFFVTPFIIAGILGMVYEGRVRQTGLGTFTKIGKKKYVSILTGNIVNFFVTAVFTIVMLIIGFLLVGLSFAAAASGETSVLGGVGIFSLLVLFAGFLVFLVVMFFLQFFGPAVVADNVGIVEGFKRSVGLVKGNLVSALGFSVLKLVITLAVLLPAFALILLPALTGAGTGAPGASSDFQSASYAGTSLLSRLGTVVYSFVVAVVMTPFRAAFSVAFYDNHRPAHWN
jgi:hypothetical protein